MGLIFASIKKHWARVLIYGAIIIGTMFMLYSAFLKPTNTTNVGDGGKVINVYDVPKQPLFSFGCSNLQVESYWKKTLRNSGR
jgi:hypothetical protein